MKKILVIATLAAFAALTSYGQGEINYQGVFHGAGNNYTTPGTVTYNTGIDIELFYAPASTTTAVSAIANSSSPASLTYQVATAWADIMGNAAFQPVDGSSGTPPALMPTTATGGATYNGGSSYSAANLLPNVTYTFYEVAWYTGASGQYSTLALANGNTYVGWSQAFQYTPVTSTGSPPPTPTTMTAGLVGDYLVGGTIPEPTTIALAGLGGLSLLLFRRRK
jgi:hypothetical protein